MQALKRASDVKSCLLQLPSPTSQLNLFFPFLFPHTSSSSSTFALNLNKKNKENEGDEDEDEEYRNELATALTYPSPSSAVSSRNKNKGFSIPWLTLLLVTNKLINRIQLLRENLHIDLTAGSVDLSSPDNIKIEIMYPHIYSLDDVLFPPQNATEPPPILIAHQLGKRAIKRLPAPVLLGALILIASELLKRKVNDEKSLELIPPVLQEALNNTAYELDSKLEILSSMRWDIDPFLQGEIDNLQSQPLVVIDKYIVRDLLPKVDKELSLVLSKLVTDPQQVTQVTKQIKDLVKLGSKLILDAEPIPSRTLNTIIDEETVNMMEQLAEKVNEKVDIVGSSIEKVVGNWNTLIEKVSHRVKSDSIINSLPEKFTSKLTMLLPSLSASKAYHPPISVSHFPTINTTTTTSTSELVLKQSNPPPGESPSILRFFATILEEEQRQLKEKKESST